MQKISFCERYMLTTAVLNRTKELTRRLEKALERAVAEYEKQYGEPFEIITQYWDEKRKKVCCLTKHGIIHVGTHYKLNEVVAVAQSYSTILNELEDPHNFDCMEHWEASSAIRAIYAEFAEYKDCPGWSNKLFVRPELMPRQIQITGIKVELLQDISDEDCLKEGIEYSKYERNWFYTNDKNTEFHAPTPREAFAALINRPGVGRKGLWEENPWVVVYKFKLVLERKMKHTENKLQKSCVNWFSYQYPEYALLLHHSPNGGRRDKKTGALFKAMGTRAGFPDLILLLPNKSHPYLCIELKTDKGRQSDEQKEWQTAVQEHALARYAIVRSVEEFIELITDYLNNR